MIDKGVDIVVRRNTRGFVYLSLRIIIHKKFEFFFSHQK